MAKTINIGRNGVFNGIFGNPIKEKTVSPKFRKHFQGIMIAYPKETQWLRNQIAEGAKLFCPGCGIGCPTCHARIIEQEIAFS